MKILKLFGGLIGLLIIIVVSAVVYLVMNLNSVVKEGVETYGPDVTQTSVNLDSVDIGLFNGKGELNNFKIGNPPGFTSGHLLKWDTIRVQVNPSSLRNDVVIIDDFTVEGVNINAEQKGLTTNLKKFLDGMKSGETSTSNKSNEQTPNDSGKEIRLALRHVKFANNEINLISEKHGSYTLSMPAFELSDLGDPNVGLTPTELGVALLKPLVERAKKEAEGKAKELLEGELKAKLDAKKEELKAKVDAEKAALEAKADEEKEALEAKADEEKDALKDKLDSKLKGFMN